MIKTIVIAIIVSFATVAGGYSGIGVSGRSAEPAAHSAGDLLELSKLEVISVPVMASGKLKGYVVVRAAFAARSDELKRAKNSLGLYSTEAIFKAVYADDSAWPEKPVQIAELTTRALSEANSRMPGNVIKQIVIENLQFVPREDVRCQEK